MQIEKIPAIFTPIQITLETREEVDFLLEFLSVAECTLIQNEQVSEYYKHTPKRNLMVDLANKLSDLVDGEEDDSIKD